MFPFVLDVIKCKVIILINGKIFNLWLTLYLCKIFFLMFGIIFFCLVGLIFFCLVGLIDRHKTAMCTK